MNQSQESMKSPNSSAAKARTEKIAALKSELKAMPKPAVSGVQAPMIQQVKICWLASFVLPLLAGVCFLGSVYGIDEEFWKHWMLMILAIYGIVALTLVLASVWTLSLFFELRDLAAGNYYVHWTIPDQSWAIKCQRSTPSALKYVAIGGLISFGAGLTAAGMAFADGNLFFATPFSHFAYTGICFLLVGCTLGSFFWRLAKVKHDYMSSRNGLILISPWGIYITGSFWSFRGAVQRLYDVSISSESPRQMQFKIGTSGENGINYKSICIPIAQSELLRAKVLRRLLQKHI